MNGLTVDWVSRHIYWTDGQKHSIEMADYDGNNRKVLGIYGLVSPRGILMDSVNMSVYTSSPHSFTLSRAHKSESSPHLELLLSYIIDLSKICIIINFSP